MKRVLGTALLLALALGVLSATGNAGQTAASMMGNVNFKETREGLYAWAGFPAPCPDPAAALILLEKYGPAEVILGDVFSYQIQISNRTNADLTGVIVEDALPNGFRLESVDPQPARTVNSRMQWNIGDLPARSAKRITISGRAEKVGCLLTTSQAKVSYDMALPLAIRVVQCDIKLKKTLPQTADLCDSIPMCLTVTNTGSAVAANVVITDSLPDGLVTADGKNQFSIAVGDMPVGTQKTFNVALAATRKGTFTNTAKAVAERNCSASDSASIRIVAPELELTASAPADGYICTTIPYQISVTNKGDSPAQDVMLVNAIGGSFEISSISHNGKAGQGRAAWNLGTLQPGETKTVNMAGSSTVETVVVSQFTATARCAKPKSVTHHLKLVGVAGVLTSVVDSIDPVIVGGTVTYTITATNTGSREDTNLRYTIHLDEGMEYTGGVGVTGITQIAADKLRFDPVPVLGTGATAAWQVTVRATSPGDKRFTAELVSDRLTTPVTKSESTNFYKPNMHVVTAK